MKKIPGRLFLLIFAIVIWLPVILLITYSFCGENEILAHFGGILISSGEPVQFQLLPSYPTLAGYAELLLDSPGFFVMFWNSVRQVLLILAGQLVISVPAAWAFAHFTFPGKKILFHLYMLLMILPFQVTMVSSYLVLDKLSLMDTQAAIILPGIFATFSVFIITKSFREIPEPLLEVASVVGAGELRMFWSIAVPLAKPGIFVILPLHVRWLRQEAAPGFPEDFW